ncbi:MAG: RlmF-related methyltransferase [Candidatus Kariarchaeaceae archaeon]
MASVIDILPWCVKIEHAKQVYPSLQKFVNSQGKIDLGDSTALAEYNKAVAYALAELKIDVPSQNLIPAICLRYAYIKLLSERYLPSQATILEIGTGASAIIALLAAKLYQFNVIATEVDLTSFKSAQLNVLNNNLQHRITLTKSEGGIIRDVISENSHFHALVTYPPLYPDYDIPNYQNGNKKRGFRGSVSEMIGGGQDGFDFLHHLIVEACNTRYEIDLVSMLLLFEQHAYRASELLDEMGRKTELIRLKAGTRIRYLVIAN